MVKKAIAIALAAGLAACGGPKDNAPADQGSPSETVSATTSDGAPVAFAQCKSCHSVEPGKHGIGPSLHGVYGTKSGDIAGYTFSAAMKDAKLTWDDATLDTFLTAPMKSVPGTKMSYAGQPDAAKRKEVIEYLKTLK
jgi:cytochrome c